MVKKQAKVTTAESAAQDLEQVLEWYAEMKVPEVGVKLVKQAREQMGQIELFPKSGRIVPEYNDPSIRELISPPFRIIYKLHNSTATVVHVWRGERLLQELPIDSAL